MKKYSKKIYRFKTEEEFLSQYGEYWKDEKNWIGVEDVGLEPNMDCFFGKRINLYKYRKIMKGNCSEEDDIYYSMKCDKGENWAIYPHMVTYDDSEEEEKFIKKLGPFIKSLDI